MSRILMFLVLLGASVTMTRSEPVLRARAQGNSRIVAAPVALDPAGGRTRVGPLRFVQGWELRSADPRFGGISGLALHGQGFLGVSDNGTAMWFDGRSASAGPRALRLLPLPVGPGTSTRKSDRDSEALVRGSDGRVWIAYENSNSIWRYTPDLRAAQAHRAPPEMRRWTANSGAEAMVRLPDGRFLVFSEGAGSVARSSDVLLFDRDPTDARARGSRMSYRLPRGFSVTDAALLGDGQVVTLHRSFSMTDGVAASVGVVDLSAFVQGAVLSPRILATLRPPMTVDNMEALVVERRGARTYLWIASDDNFTMLQRTLLMQFELVKGG